MPLWGGRSTHAWSISEPHQALSSLPRLAVQTNGGRMRSSSLPQAHCFTWTVSRLVPVCRAILVRSVSGPAQGGKVFLSTDCVCPSQPIAFASNI
eukprot:320272-Alexandrium_andersonii.AAC.1